MKKLAMLVSILGLSYSLVLGFDAQRVCTTSSQPQNNRGKCRVSPYGDGDICYFDSGSGTPCNGTLVKDNNPPSIG
ncbi:hypothetical protein [Algoriphagus marinus]|uniref:hypothetical protein n=1 Tax=Algoriphagus marinus TaxID=1925762 RepID=UPI000B1C6DB9|nr:hypothetical protein [Algoriphagus marinus]